MAYFYKAWFDSNNELTIWLYTDGTEGLPQYSLSMIRISGPHTSLDSCTKRGINTPWCSVEVCEMPKVCQLVTVYFVFEIKRSITILKRLPWQKWYITLKNINHQDNHRVGPQRSALPEFKPPPFAYFSSGLFISIAVNANLHFKIFYPNGLLFQRDLNVFSIPCLAGIPHKPFKLCERPNHWEDAKNKFKLLLLPVMHQITDLPFVSPSSLPSTWTMSSALALPPNPCALLFVFDDPLLINRNEVKNQVDNLPVSAIKFKLLHLGVK